MVQFGHKIACSLELDLVLFEPSESPVQDFAAFTAASLAVLKSSEFSIMDSNRSLLIISVIPKAAQAEGARSPRSSPAPGFSQGFGLRISGFHVSVKPFH